MDKLAIIGAGALGTALKKRFESSGARISVYDSDSKKNLGGSFEQTITGATAIFLCIPTKSIEEILEKIVKLNNSAIIVSFSKGMTRDGGTAAEILDEGLGEKLKWAVVGGPMISEDIADNKNDVCAAIGSKNIGTAEAIEEIFKKADIAAVSNFDPFAISFLGILKNIYAFGMGILDGLLANEVEKNYFVKIALSEMKKFCEIKKFNPDIVDTPAGEGDLLATSKSAHSRNRAMGFELVTTQKISTNGESLSAAHHLTNILNEKLENLPMLALLIKILEGKSQAKDVRAHLNNNR